MQHTIFLTESSELALRKIAEKGGQSADQALETIAEAVLTGHAGTLHVEYERGVLKFRPEDNSLWPIRRTPGVMGGDACVRDTRIAVWLLVQFKQSGFSDERIFANYPGLTNADLIAA